MCFSNIFEVILDFFKLLSEVPHTASQLCKLCCSGRIFSIHFQKFDFDFARSSFHAVLNFLIIKFSLNFKSHLPCCCGAYRRNVFFSKIILKSSEEPGVRKRAKKHKKSFSFVVERSDLSILSIFFTIVAFSTTAAHPTSIVSYYTRMFCKPFLSLLYGFILFYRILFLHNQKTLQHPSSYSLSDFF